MLCRFFPLGPAPRQGKSLPGKASLRVKNAFYITGLKFSLLVYKRFPKTSKLLVQELGTTLGHNS